MSAHTFQPIEEFLAQREAELNAAARATIAAQRARAATEQNGAR